MKKNVKEKNIYDYTKKLGELLKENNQEKLIEKLIKFIRMQYDF